MTQPTGLHSTIEAWADIVIKMWLAKIVELDVIDQGYLQASFVNHVVHHAGGNAERIDFMFRQYGIFQDMGVGKETAKGNPGDLWDVTYTNQKGKQALRRQPKPWYSKVFFREVSKLREFMSTWYGYQGALAVMEAFGDDIYDKRSDKKALVGSLRTIAYRERNNARRRKNYAEFGFRAWRSRNKH